MLSEEMIELAINNGQKCIFYNVNYVLLFKTMPCTDERLEDYINKINRLEKSGVNISSIIDYKLVGPKSVFNDKSFTKGVFLEKRAKGNCIGNIKNININESDNIEELIELHLKNIDKYLNELERRSNASTKVFDKLINDYLSVFKIGLSPDPKPLNFFYDEKDGFTIIDLIDVESESLEVELKNLAKIIYIIIFGYGIPKLSYKYNILNVISNNHLERLNKILTRLDDKIISSLVKCGIDKDLIMISVLSNREKYNDLIGVDNYKQSIYREIERLSLEKKNKEDVIKFTF